MTPPPVRALRDVRIPGAPLLAVAGALVAFAGLLYETRHLNFFYDEWDFLNEGRHWTLRGFFLPHAEHWSTIPKLVYAGLLAVVGTRHYWPYMAIELAVHIATALMLFRIVRRHAGDLAGLMAAATLMVLGRGWENIIWAFQVGFDGSLFFGLLALDLLDRETPSVLRQALASAALVCSLMCSGVGLFMCALIALWLLAEFRTRLRLLVVLAAPAIAYALWHFTAGKGSTSFYGPPVTIDGIAALRTYVPFGLGSAAAGMLSLSSLWAPSALVALSVALALRWQRLGRPPALAAAAVVGVVLQFALTGLVRWRFGDAQAASPRYVYIGSIFLLLALASSFGASKLGPRVLAGLLIVFLACTALSAYHLRQAVAGQNGVLQRQDDELRVAAVFRNAPSLSPGARIDVGLLPQIPIGDYYAIVDRFGSPVAPLSFDQLGQIPPAEVDNVLLTMFGKSVRVTSPAGSPLALCRPAESTPEGVAATGGALLIPKPVGTYDLYLWYEAGRPATPLEQVTIGSGGVLIQPPDLGRPLPAHLLVTVPPDSAAYVCG